MVSTTALYWIGATAAVAVAAGGGVLAMHYPDVWPASLISPSLLPNTSAPSAPPVAAPKVSASPETAPQVKATPSEPTAAPSQFSPNRPAFDVVRVEPGGDAVVAGHAAPQAHVELQDEGRAIAEVDADPSGQFVILPPQLSAGQHHLQLAVRGVAGEPLTSDAVAIDVAPQKLAALHAATPPPAQPASLAFKPIPSPAPGPAAPTPALTAVELAPSPAPVKPLVAQGTASVFVETVEATDPGRLLVKGSAEANATVRLYLNGSFVADASAGPDRRWSLTIEHGMAPGLYTLRADEIDRASGRVLARAEAPFAYPQHPSSAIAALASAGPSPAPAPAPVPSENVAPVPTKSASPEAPVAATSFAGSNASASAPKPTPLSAATSVPAPTPSLEAQVASEPAGKPPANVVVSEVHTATVVRGDNLWDLARRFYGDGTRFRQIYEANSSLIRDPNLIYIGQIFVVPKQTPP